MHPKIQQKSFLKAFYGFLAVVVVFNSGIAIMKLLEGQPLDYFDLAVISGMPAGFIAGLITGIFKRGLSGATAFAAFLNSFVVLLIVVLLPNAFELTLLPALGLNIIVGVLVGVALGLRD